MTESQRRLTASPTPQPAQPSLRMLSLGSALALHARPPSLPTIWNRRPFAEAPTGPSLPGPALPRSPDADLGLLGLAAALAVLLLREVAVFAVRHLPRLQRKPAASVPRRARSSTPSLSFPASAAGEETPRVHFRQQVRAIAKPSPAPPPQRVPVPAAHPAPAAACTPPRSPPAPGRPPQAHLPTALLSP